MVSVPILSKAMLQGVREREEEEQERAFGPSPNARGANCRQQHQQIDIERESPPSDFAGGVAYQIERSTGIGAQVQRDHDQMRQSSPMVEQPRRAKQNAGSETPGKFRIPRVPARARGVISGSSGRTASPKQAAQRQGHTVFGGQCAIVLHAGYLSGQIHRC